MALSASEVFDRALSGKEQSTATDEEFPFQWTNESLPYKSLIEESELMHGIPKNLLARNIKQESRFNPKAVSPKGAQGIAQILPSAHPGVDALNPKVAIPYAAGYLKSLYNQFGSWDQAIAAYNYGPENLKKTGMANLPVETLQHVSNVYGQIPTNGTPLSASDVFDLAQPKPVAPVSKEPTIVQPPKPPGGYDELGRPLAANGIPYPAVNPFTGEGSSNKAFLGVSYGGWPVFGFGLGSASDIVQKPKNPLVSPTNPRGEALSTFRGKETISKPQPQSLWQWMRGWVSTPTGTGPDKAAIITGLKNQTGLTPTEILKNYDELTNEVIARQVPTVKQIGQRAMEAGIVAGAYAHPLVTASVVLQFMGMDELVNKLVSDWKGVPYQFQGGLGFSDLMQAQGFSKDAIDLMQFMGLGLMIGGGNFEAGKKVLEHPKAPQAPWLTDQSLANRGIIGKYLSYKRDKIAATNELAEESKVTGKDPTEIALEGLKEPLIKDELATKGEEVKVIKGEPIPEDQLKLAEEEVAKVKAKQAELDAAAEARKAEAEKKKADKEAAKEAAKVSEIEEQPLEQPLEEQAVETQVETQAKPLTGAERAAAKKKSAVQVFEEATGEEPTVIQFPKIKYTERTVTQDEYGGNPGARYTISFGGERIDRLFDETTLEIIANDLKENKLSDAKSRIISNIEQIRDKQIASGLNGGSRLNELIDIIKSNTGEVEKINVEPTTIDFDRLPKSPILTENDRAMLREVKPITDETTLTEMELLTKQTGLDLFGLGKKEPTEKTITLYRGEGENVGAGTEGIGTYAFTDRESSKFFGEPREITISQPKKTITADKTLLLTESDEVFEPIKKSDSEWVKLNKQAVKDVGATNKKWDEVAVEKRLTELLKERGYDTVLVDAEGKGGRQWYVILDKGLIKEPRESITDLDLQTGTPLPEALSTDKNPFRETDPEVTTKKNELYSGLKSVANTFNDLFNNPTKPYRSPETTTSKLINDVNRWLDGDDAVDIAKTRDMLSEMAARADELKPEFSMDLDHKNWATTTSEAAVWARGADRAKIERTGEPGIQLNAGFDPTKIIELIPKPLREFSKRFHEDLNKRVEEIIGKVTNYDKWQFGIGDRIKSKQSDNVYEITTRTWDMKNDRPMYGYKGVGDKAGESGQFIADRAHENFIPLRGPQGTTRLNIAIPLDEIPKVVKDLISKVKVTFGDLYRNKEIYDKTGFWLGRDGMWRYELKDPKIRIEIPLNARVGDVIPLRDVVKGLDEAFEAIPDLQTVGVKYSPGLSANGDYNSASRLIQIRDLRNKDTMIHEVQHAINDLVGSEFRGSNYDKANIILDIKDFADALNTMRNTAKNSDSKKLISDMIGLLNKEAEAPNPSKGVIHSFYTLISPELAKLEGRDFVNSIREMYTNAPLGKGTSRVHETYMKDPGEMQSRLEEIRDRMTPAQRKAEYPWETLEKMLVDEGLQSVENVPGGIGTRLYSGIPLDEIAKRVKGNWKAFRERDDFLRNQIKAWLMGKSDTMPRPIDLYRGVPQGKSVMPEKGEGYVHGTPWAYDAASGGKWGEPEGYDVYRVPAKYNTIYYRGGSLAGDPLERTRIHNAQGMTWEEIMTAAKKLYMDEVIRDAADVKRRGLPEQTDADRRNVADRVLSDIQNATFETDLQDKPGIWRGRPFTEELRKDYPNLRSYEDLQEVVNEKRRQGYSDELIPEIDILKKGGYEPLKLYTGADIKDTLIKSAGRAADYVIRAHEIKKFKAGPAYRALKENFEREFVDRSGNIRQELLDKLGEVGYKIVQKMYLSKGSGSMAAVMLKQMQKEVYGGLSSNEKKILDTLILTKRILDIANYKSAKQFTPPEDLTPEISAGYQMLFDKKKVNHLEDLTPDRAAAVKKAMDSYFEWMKKPLKDMLDAQLISQKEYDLLVAHNYRRTKLVDLFDKRQPNRLGKKAMTVYDSGVEALQKGKNTDIYEPSSEIMALEVFNRAYGRIFNNAANSTLLDLALKQPDNPFVRTKIKGGAAIPKGWSPVFVFTEGKRKAIYLSPEMSKEWIINSPDISYKLAQVLRYATGSPVLRTMATGINWAFALANLPRDIMHIWYASRVFEDGKWTNLYNSNFPVYAAQMGRDLTSTFTDALLRKGRYLDYIREGGGMEFLVHQGRLFQKGRHLGGNFSKIMDFLGYLGETSEIMTRLAIRERAMRQGKSAQEATFAARDYMDFGQGGGIAKAADNAFPYLNASIQGMRGLGRAFKENPIASSWKLSQFAAATVGTYIAGNTLAPNTMAALRGNVAMRNNICIPLGDDFGMEDEKGQMRYFFFKLPLDPSQRLFKALFEAGTDAWLGNKVDTGRIAGAMADVSPIGSWLPPMEAGAVGYMNNTNFWLNEDIWTRTDKPAGYKLPKWLTGGPGGSEKEFIEGQTPQAFIDLGKVTGLSPERSKYAIEQLVTGGSMFGYLAGQGYDAFFSDLPKKEKQWHLMEALSRYPLTSRFIGMTNPYTQYAENIQETQNEIQFRKFQENSGLDLRARGYLYDGNYSKGEVDAYINEFKDRDTRDRLKDRFKFLEKMVGNPALTFYTRLKGLDDEARARVYLDTLDKATPDEYANITRGYSQAERAGGIVTEGFKKHIRELRNQGYGR